MSDQMFLTREDAARVAGVKLDTIRRAIAAGKLAAKKTGKDGGGKILVSREALAEWFEGLADA